MFDLPKELIAQTPARPRDHARLLVYDRSSRKITDDVFYNLEKYLPKNSTLVFNNSKVEKCRLRFEAAEVFVLETLNPTTVRALVKPGKRFRAGATFAQGSSLEIQTIAVEDGGVRVLRFNKPVDHKSLDKFRLTPFPPYISQNEQLAGQYQTVYAKPLGSKAAPTAGLHFTQRLLKELSLAHKLAYITLHVGLGTFAPVKVENLKAGKLHAELFELSSSTSDILNSSSHITSVGTTTARTLETIGRPFGPASELTEIFITPGYDFKAIDSLITNFHLPGSSLLMLVAAFMGSTAELQRIYAHAIKKQYRFYSFGDAMLIL